MKEWSCEWHQMDIRW